MAEGLRGPAGRPTPGVPDDAERFIVQGKPLSISASRLEGLDDDVLDEYGLEIPDEDQTLARSQAIDVGEEIPPEIAHDVYSAFFDRIAAEDGNGRRVD